MKKKKINFKIPYWFDELIPIDDKINEKFQEKRISDLLKKFPPTLINEYIAFSNPFSERLEYYISRKKLKKYSFKILDHYSSEAEGGPNPKFVISHFGNQLIRLKKGFYFFSFMEQEGTGSTFAQIVIFVNEEGVIWNKQKITKLIYKFAKELSEFQENKRVEKSNPNAFDRIFLPNANIEDIKSEVENFLGSRKMYAEDLKLPWKRGILFVGPPGNGKTSLLRAICNYFGLEYKDIKESIKRNGDVDMPSPNGKGIDTVLFPTGNDVTVWIMEDIDKLVDFNGDKESLSSSVSLHDVLKGLDGINQIDGALILATTNYANVLTESLANRPGRFDRIYEIKIPLKKEILNLLKYHSLGISDDEDGLEIVAEKLEGFSMAFAEEYVKSVKMIYKRNSITTEESDKILNRIVKHNKEFENKFEEKSNGFGFGK